MKNMPDLNPATSAAKPNRNLAAVRISGPDRFTLLQGQLTQDLDQLAPEKPLLAGWTTPKGRLICVCWLLDWENAIWLLVPAELSQPISQRLGMYVLRADAQVESSDIPVLPANQESITSLPRADGTPEINLINNCYFNDSFYYLEPAKDAGLAVGIATPGTDTSAWRLANIRAGLPSVWPETRELFVPQMLNLDLLGAISFTKGCYVGQEIIARTQNLGRIKRRMYSFQADAGVTIQPGDPIYNEEGTQAGSVVDAIAADTATELLAVIRIELLNSTLSLSENGGLPLVPAALPYTVPESI